jgi:hypothetical protein
MHNKAPEISSTFATTIQLYPLAVNVGGENILPPYKPNHNTFTNFPMPLPLHINLCHVQDVTDWLLRQWRTEEGFEGFTPPPRNSEVDKAEPNSQFHGKYICNNLIRIQISLIFKFSGTPD